MNRFKALICRSHLWLVLGLVLFLFSHGRVTIPICSWFAFVFLIRFRRTHSRPWLGDNLHAIEQALKTGGNPDLTVIEFPCLNHLFQSSQTEAVAEYATHEGACNLKALNTIFESAVLIMAPRRSRTDVRQYAPGSRRRQSAPNRAIRPGSRQRGPTSAATNPVAADVSRHGACQNENCCLRVAAEAGKVKPRMLADIAGYR